MADSIGASTGLPVGQCPFVPASGKVPPYLAGRESEQGLIRNQLAWLQEAAGGSDVIIYGPRGNGKTALMEWALRQARARGVATLKFTSADIESKEWLARHLSAVPSWLRLLSGVTLPGIGIRTRDAPAGLISDALARRARKRALVVAVDEAHVLAHDAGRALLNAVQRSRTDEVPVMLLLAGTPDLPRHLNSMEASFWDRSEILPLGLLKPDAAADAIRIPMESGDLSISAEALARVVAESHGYPYFLQLWGHLLWTEMADPARPASLDDVIRIRPRFERARNIYYRNRYVELKRAKLASVAARLALAFADTGRLTDLELEGAIRLALESEGLLCDTDAVMAACDRLHDLGYIWSVGGESRQYFRPGIPSLMQYVARSGDIDVGSVGE